MSTPEQIIITRLPVIFIDYFLGVDGIILGPHRCWFMDKLWQSFLRCWEWLKIIDSPTLTGRPVLDTLKHEWSLASGSNYIHVPYFTYVYIDVEFTHHE